MWALKSFSVILLRALKLQMKSPHIEEMAKLEELTNNQGSGQKITNFEPQIDEINLYHRYSNN